VSPTIVLPGRWSEADLRFQAEHIATQRLHNGGYNCVASQVVVVGSDWPQKDRFLAHLRAALTVLRHGPRTIRAATVGWLTPSGRTPTRNVSGTGC